MWALWQETRIIRKRLRRIDHLLTVSNGFREILLANGIGTPATLSTVYNLPPSTWAEPAPGVFESWRNRLKIQPSSRVIVAVGKRSLGKGTPYLVEAMAAVHKKHPGAILTLVGKGYDPPAAPFLRVVQPVAQKDLAGLYSLSSLVVIPSIWPEPFSRVFLESMTAGKPVIATEVGGSREGVIPGETGWLIPAKNQEALAGALIAALDAPDETLERMGRRAREVLNERFSAKISLQRLIKIYSQQGEIFRSAGGAFPLAESPSVS
jgi:glycosyltransferase involved in cell wall biosynthesis